jgi:hypothetical protein
VGRVALAAWSTVHHHGPLEVWEGQAGLFDIINDGATVFWQMHMPDQNLLTLRAIDQTRTDFALIESNLEFLAGQLARVPTLR